MGYSLKYDKEKMARAVLRSGSLSLKDSLMICNFIRGKKAGSARKMLEEVLLEKKAIPFTRFHEGAGHKKGKVGPGKYPKKAVFEFIKIINAAEANAQNKGLNTGDLIIDGVCANRAGTQWHYGRQRRRKMKRTHLEIVVKEGEKVKRKDEPKKMKKEKAAENKSEPNKEVKQETKEENKK